VYAHNCPHTSARQRGQKVQARASVTPAIVNKVSKSSLQRRPLHRQSRYNDQNSENGWFALQHFFLTTATTPDTTTSQIGKVSLYSNLTLAAKRACRPFPLCLGASNCVQSATKEHIHVLQPLPTLECLENVCS
jgi:hypothetical protein